jgi:thioredoxin 2
MVSTCESCGAENRVPFGKLDRHPKCGRCKQALPPPALPIHVDAEADFDALVRDSPWPVVVDFWAAWCGPCRTVAPELERLAGAKAGQVLIAKVDTERLPAVAQRFAIRSIPTLVRFDRGSETKRTSGAMRAEQLAQALSL